jgi:hypothetical protein
MATPSFLERRPSKESNIGRKAIPKINQKFLREILLSISSPPPINTAMPIIKVILTIFAPMIFPKEKLGIPWKADVIPINNSGREVASPIRKKEIVYSEMRSILAKLVKETTRKVLDFTSNKNDIINAKK